jgi:hypothetical protein
VLDPVYRAVAWQRVDQICYNTFSNSNIFSPRRVQMDIIRMDTKEARCESVDRIHVAQDRIQGRGVWFLATVFYEEFHILRCNSVYSIEIQPMFLENTSLPSSESKNKPNKKPV